MNLIRFAIMPLTEAKSLQDQLKKEGIDIVLNHNEQTCTRGCTVTVEVTGKEDDASKVAEIYHQNFKKLTEGMDINWEAIDSIYDPEASEVTCPACSFKFDPAQGECPDCGLVFA